MRAAAAAVSMLPHHSFISYFTDNPTRSSDQHATLCCCYMYTHIVMSINADRHSTFTISLFFRLRLGSENVSVGHFCRRVSECFPKAIVNLWCYSIRNVITRKRDASKAAWWPEQTASILSSLHESSTLRNEDGTARTCGIREICRRGQQTRRTWSHSHLHCSGMDIGWKLDSL